MVCYTTFPVHYTKSFERPFLEVRILSSAQLELRSHVVYRTAVAYVKSASAIFMTGEPLELQRGKLECQEFTENMALTVQTHATSLTHNA